MAIQERERINESQSVPYIWAANGVENADAESLWYKRRLERASYLHKSTDYWQQTTIAQSIVIPVIFPQMDVKHGLYVIGALLEGIRKPTGKNTLLLDRGGALQSVANMRDGTFNGPDVTRTLAKQKRNPLLDMPNGISTIPLFEHRASLVNDRMKTRNLDLFTPIRPKDVHLMVPSTAEALKRWLGHDLGFQLKENSDPDGSVTLTTPFDPDLFNIYDRVLGWRKNQSHHGERSVFTFAPESPPKHIQFHLKSFPALENPAVTIFCAQVRAIDEQNRLIDDIKLFAKPEPDTQELALLNTRAGRYVDSSQNVAQSWLPNGTIRTPPLREILNTEPRQPMKVLKQDTLGQLAEKWSRLLRRSVLAATYAPAHYSIARKFPASTHNTTDDMAAMSIRMEELDRQGQKLTENKRRAVDTDVATAFQHNPDGTQMGIYWGTKHNREAIFPRSPLGYMHTCMPSGPYSSYSAAVVYYPETDQLEWDSGIKRQIESHQEELVDAHRALPNRQEPLPSEHMPSGSLLAKLLWQFEMWPNHET